MRIERVLVVDDEESVADWLRVLLKEEGYFVRTAGSGSRALAELDRNDWDLVFLDLNLPDTEGATVLDTLKTRDPNLIVVLMSEGPWIEERSIARQAEAFLQKPRDLDPERVLRLLGEFKERPHPASRWESHGIVGQSPEMQRVFTVLNMVAATDGHVLLIGESGTGKELTATAIHAVSARARKPLVKLAGSSSFDELAHGLVEANKGSLFIDQITDLPVDLQQRLCFVLEEKRLPRRGSRAVDLDVRVMASTCLDPGAAIRENRLSRDLYYRIGVLLVHLPPLRERSADLPVLVGHLLARAAKKYRLGMMGTSREAQAVLLAHTWPCNVLELEQVIERAAIVARSREIQIADLPESIRASRALKEPRNPPDAKPPTLRLDVREREAIIQALQASGWNKDAAARALGLHRPTLYSKMRKHGIPLRRPG